MWRHPPLSRGPLALTKECFIRRKPRADAARNRQRLIEAARARFAAEGTGASLEEIARDAGVGIGTLYRNFPTREALVEDVYRHELARLGETAVSLAASHPPIEALRAWLLLFVDYLATKKIMASALTSPVGSELYTSATRTLEDSIGLLTSRAVEAGAIRMTMPPLDLLRAITGIANSSPGAQWDASARAMIDVLLAGMRT